MLAIWSLVPLPFLNPAWTSGSSRFTYCWSLAWRILSIVRDYFWMWTTVGQPQLMCNMCAQSLSHVWLFVSPCSIDHQAPLSMKFSQWEYWSGVPCSKFFKLGFNSTWTENFQMYKVDLEKAENQRSNCQHPFDHRKSKRIPEKYLFLLHWLY